MENRAVMDEDKIGRLIEDLKNVDLNVRRRAISKLAKLDTEHAETALHWAMVNDLDEEIRDLAHSAYEQIHAKQTPVTEQAKPAKPAPKAGRPHSLSTRPPPKSSAQRSRPDRSQTAAIKNKRKANLADASHMAILEEKPEPRNVFGDISLKLAIATLALIITEVLLEAPHEKSFPIYVHMVKILAKLTPIAGFMMAILGMTGKKPRKLIAKIGLAANLFFVVFSVIWLIRLFSK